MSARSAGLSVSLDALSPLDNLKAWSVVTHGLSGPEITQVSCKCELKMVLEPCQRA